MRVFSVAKKDHGRLELDAFPKEVVVGRGYTLDWVSARSRRAKGVPEALQVMLGLWCDRRIAPAELVFVTSVAQGGRTGIASAEQFAQPS